MPMFFFKAKIKSITQAAHLAPVILMETVCLIWVSVHRTVIDLQQTVEQLIYFLTAGIDTGDLCGFLLAYMKLRLLSYVELSF